MKEEKGKIVKEKEPRVAAGHYPAATFANDISWKERLTASLGARTRRWFGANQWVVGYPKCGNTWISILVRKAITLSYGLPESSISDVFRDWRIASRNAGPSIGATHQMPHFNAESWASMSLNLMPFRNRRVVLLVRDPADVLVSLYMHNVYREDPPLYRGTADTMVFDPVYGLDKFLRYYQQWYSQRERPSALRLVRYEDLWRDTHNVLADVLDFLGIPNIDSDLIGEVVGFGSFDNMRKLERDDTLGLAPLRPAAGASDRSNKVRSGAIGDHHSHLSPATISYIRRRVAAELPDFYGYRSPPEPTSREGLDRSPQSKGSEQDAGLPSEPRTLAARRGQLGVGSRAQGDPKDPVPSISDVSVHWADLQERDGWDAWMKSNGGSVFQCSEWADYQLAYMGGQAHYLTLRRAGEVIGYWLVLEQPQTGESLVQWRKGAFDPVALVPRALSWREGPVISEDGFAGDVYLSALGQIAVLLRGTGVSGISSSWSPIAVPTGESAEEISRLGYDVKRLATTRIDVGRPIEDIWKSLKGSVARTPVRKAERQGLRLVEVRNQADVDRYFDLIRSWRTEQSLRPVARQKYSLLLERMPSTASMFLAEMDGVAVGAAGIWHFGAGGYLFSPVQSVEARESRIYAGDFLIWELIRWSKANGLRYFDLSGIQVDPSSDKDRGIRRFKEKWGGDYSEYLSIEQSFGGWRWRAVDLLRSTRDRVLPSGE